MASYKGFVFGSFAPEGETLEEHLGAACGAIDALCLTSPEGEIEVTAGYLKHKVDSNWKFLVENETDGYHPSFVHASIFEVAKSGIGTLYSGDSTAVSRSFGKGHSENDLRPEFRKRDVPMSWFNTTAERLPDYTARMQAAYGVEKARHIMIEGTPHIMIFPNLFIAEIQLFVIQPLSVNETVATCHGASIQGRARLESPHAAADDGLGRPGRLPARRRCRDVRTHAARRAVEQARVPVSRAAASTASAPMPMAT